MTDFSRVHPIDFNLVDEIAKQPRTVIFPDLGLATRMSMLYWATRNESTQPLVVAPKILHQWYGEMLRKPDMMVNGEVRTIQLITPQSLLYRKHIMSKRVMHEMSDMGVSQRQLIKEAVEHGSQICVRCLHNHPNELWRVLQPMGFARLRYVVGRDKKDRPYPHVLRD